jgi:hypothetical protein
MTDTPTDPPEDRGLLWQRIQHQQEVRDRWFTYSLALLAVPLLMAAAFEKADLKDPYAVAGAMAIFAFVGFFFLLLYTRQRINYLDLYKQYSPRPVPPAGSYLLLRAQLWGADFYANCVQACMNAGLLLASMYYFGCKHAVGLAVSFFLIFWVQMFVRQCVLRRRGCD